LSVSSPLPRSQVLLRLRGLRGLTGPQAPQGLEARGGLPDSAVGVLPRDDARDETRRRHVQRRGGAAGVGPAGRVLAIEPSPYVHGILAEAVAANRLANVTVLRSALGRAAGELTLYVPPDSTGNHTPSVIPIPGRLPVAVPVQRLDEVLTAAGIDRVDVLKLDVEGYEGEVLAGAERYLSEGRIGVLLVEFNEWCQQQLKSTSLALWDSIVAHGFEANVPRPASVRVEESFNVLFRHRTARR